MDKGSERSLLSNTTPKTDLLVKEESKNKHLSLYLENNKNLGFNAPVSSQEDVKKMFKKIQKLSKEVQLSIMKREIKLKKLLFCELPPDYPLFRQYNIAPNFMFNNLLALHVVEESNQESISVKNIYEITKSLSFPVSEQEKKVRALPETQAPAIADLE